MATTTTAPTLATAATTVGLDPFGPLEVQHAYMTALAHGLRGRLLGTVLSTALFGIFALCTCITITMISRKLGKARWAMWYTSATVIMLASTSIYWAFMLRNTFVIGWASTSVASGLVPVTMWTERCLSNSTLCSDLSNLPDTGVDSVSQLPFHDLPLEYCVGTAALTTNIIIGDAIVLSRVYVLWSQSRLIRLVSGFLLLGTAAMGLVSTAHSCRGFSGTQGFLAIPTADAPGTATFVGPPDGNLLGSFFEGDPFGVAASMLSLTTNVVSTCLIGWQAWKHRALVHGNGLRSYLGRSQVSKAFTLLIESGAFHSVIWIFVVTYQFVSCPSYTTKFGEPGSSAFRAFTTGWEAFTEGALVTVIAIYPTIIMLVVALNSSECDTIASYHHSKVGPPMGQSDAALVFRGSITHSVDFPPNGLSVEGRASTILSSFSDNGNCSRGAVDVP